MGAGCADQWTGISVHAEIYLGPEVHYVIDIASERYELLSIGPAGRN